MPRSNRARDLGSEAYGSSDKSNFRTKLTVSFDFSDAERSLRSARRSLEDMNKEARELTKKLNRTNKGYGTYISANAVKDRNAQGNQLMSFNIPAIEKDG